MDLEKLPSNKTSNVPSVQYFFPGIKYKFIDNDAPHVGWRTNDTCTGVSIVLHPSEPPDNGFGNVRMLRYPPLAVIVRPDSPIPEGMAGEGVLPVGCIPVMSKAVHFSLKFPDARMLFRDDTDEVGYEVRVKRVCIPLDHAMAVTDFYAQGMSFKGDAFLIHLTPPHGSAGIERPNVLVCTSRPSDWFDFHLLAPLWPPGNLKERERVITALHRALRPRPEFVAEMARLRLLAKATRDEFWGLYSANW